MGADTFFQRGKGETAAKAFLDAREEAAYEHGHKGYTGSLAEKSEFTVIAVPAGADPERFAQSLIDNDDPRIEDKRGPAGCIKLGAGEYLFFGWAPC